MTVITSYATAQSVNLDDIISNALMEEYVLGARAFEIDGTIVVATLTAPFILKSERDCAKAQLCQHLQTLYADAEIVVTFDMQVYRNIENELDRQSKQALLELAKSR